MSDLISRQAAIEAIREVMLWLFDFTDDDFVEPLSYTEERYLRINKMIAEQIKALPTVQPKLDKNDMPEQGDPAKFGVKTDETCTDCISRQAAIDTIVKETTMDGAYDYIDTWDAVRILSDLPSIDAVQVIRCKDCKHRPKRLEEGEGEGLNLDFPDDNFRCPCRCDDGWYNWMPDDNWFCGNGERKES